MDRLKDLRNIMAAFAFAMLVATALGCDVTSLTGPAEVDNTPIALSPAPGADDPEIVISSGGLSTSGFDEYGYNDVAGVFNGIADGIDRNIDGTYFGDARYALDKILMKWNHEWDRGNAEGWANPPYAAWINNEWNGMDGGSGETWHYKIVWSESCKSSNTAAGGGYCIWGQFEVILSQGTAGEHFWDVLGSPAGYGAY